MINPFRTRKIIHISPKRQITYEIPFIGKIRSKITNNTYIPIADCKGEYYDVVILDEVIKVGKTKRLNLISTPLGKQSFKEIYVKLGKNNGKK